jgi:hypothetical protein
MELVVRKNDLLKELSLLQGIVERKNTIPILAKRFDRGDKGRHFTTRDGFGCWLAQPVRRHRGEAGVLTLPAKKAV